MASKRVTVLKRINDEAKRNATFVRLTNDIRRRVHELSTVHKVDVGVIVTSPSGNMITISGPNCAADIILRYLMEQAPVRGRHVIRNRQRLKNSLERKKLMKNLADQLARIEAMMDGGVDMETFYTEHDVLWENISKFKEEIPKFFKTNEAILCGKFVVDLINRVRFMSARIDWTLLAIEHVYYKKLQGLMHRINAGDGLPPAVNNPVPMSKRKFKFLKAPPTAYGMQGMAGSGRESGGSNGNAGAWMNHGSCV